MEDVTRTLHSGRLNPPLERTVEEWEDWEDDDEPLTPLNAGSGDGRLINRNSGAARPSPSPRRSTFASRLSVERPIRPRSRQRQKAQNAKAGISLITDMSKFRQQQLRNGENRVSRTGRFVDAAALSALEGTSAAQEGSSFGWFKKKAGQTTKAKTPERLEVEPPRREDLSPSGGPIMIGFAMPSDSNVVISPQTALVESPIDFDRYLRGDLASAVSTKAPASAWSPDSEDIRASQRTVGTEGAGKGRVPAVPSVPKEYRNTQATTVILTDDEGESPRKAKKSKRHTRITSIFLSDDEDDGATPVTLFEEDGSPGGAIRRSLKQKGRQRSGTTTSIRSQGWWDQVITPFTRTPTTPQAGDTKESGGWWKDSDKKSTPTSPKYKFTFPTVKASSPIKKTGPTKDNKPASPVVKVTPPAPETTTIIHEHKPKVSEKRVDVDAANKILCSTEQSQRPPRIVVQAASPPLSSSPVSMAAPPRARVRAAKNPTVEDEDDQKQPSEQPPPYSPPHQKHNIRYQVVLPPGHPRHAQMGNYREMYPPSPGPVSPGLSRTMTSQGAIGLRNVPLTPPPAAEHRSAYMPDRPLGSFRPSDNLPSADGNGIRQKAERKRRRYEQEDAVAFKAGNAWRGRACCIPFTACFGRPGREGRKRRRICLCIGIVIIILIALAIILPLTVFRSKRVSGASPQSQFLNLTTFPPMPTGINTVVGTDSVTTSNCVSPPTMWSCSLPKEQASAAAPYDASQAGFIFHIQFDNSTRQLWNTPEPTLTARNGPVGVSSYLQQRQQLDSGARPNPPPPRFKEMAFLGNSTDGVASPNKAGEPTPFYISILRSLDDPVGPTVLSRRQATPSNTTTGQSSFASILPPAALNPDGTAAPAVLLPFPAQQPLRLYDRGLPTERYAFYTYFNKTTYLKSILPLDKNTAAAGPVPADLNGGALRTEANFVITWLQTRYKVEIWTRKENTTRLVTDGTRPAGNATRPGTFPYPVTVTLDNHGGEPLKKFAFIRGVDERQRVVEANPKVVVVDLKNKGDLVNPPGPNFDASLGGMDGGTGGCSRVSLGTLRAAPALRPHRAHGLLMLTSRHSPLISTSPTRRSLLTLAIETSCDDTCVAVLEKNGPSARLLFNKKITSDNTQFGGVHPTVAILSHTANLPGLVQDAIKTFPPDCARPDFVTVTRGPGMPTNLAVGLNVAKGLACAWGVPLLAVHHMQAHALTPRLVSALSKTPKPPSSSPEFDPASPSASPRFPFLTLLVSGGHTQLVLSRSLTAHTILANASNPALGNMLDAAARCILPPSLLSSLATVSYGPALEEFAFPRSTTSESQEYSYAYTPPPNRAAEILPFTSPYGWQLTAPLATRRAMAFDYNGLGSQIARIAESGLDISERRALARAAMKMAFEHLASRIIFALAGEATGGPPLAKRIGKGKSGTECIETLVLSGGVASNRFLRHVVRSVLDARGYGQGRVRIVAPPVELCTDNAAMVAWTGMEMWEAGYRSELDVLVERRWSVDGERK
ncbi:glycoprotease family-domain-containing protein [Cercophora newfieldiana]|uniref:N(6)-L-threonylcarbamoyladenine synthase n=1 Tax=Cercophora newfieldiana TaxID=92897 RepID=A0AA39YPL3_9PEZI|nr:glycoprotease family-domain-containing protein [Cercophora newfieldiana]